MTDKAMAIVPKPQSSDIIRMPHVPDLGVIEAVWKLAQHAARSNMTKSNNPDDAFFIAMYGLELGIPAITAMRTIYKAGDGAPTCSGEAMLSLIRRSGKVKVTVPNPGEVTNTATVTFERLDSGEKQSFTFTMAMAEKAGLLSNPAWKKYQHMMMIWRCVSMGGKLLCSDIIGGLHTYEELNPTAQVDENGEPVGPIEGKFLIEREESAEEVVVQPIAPTPQQQLRPEGEANPTQEAAETVAETVASPSPDSAPAIAEQADEGKQPSTSIHPELSENQDGDGEIPPISHEEKGNSSKAHSKPPSKLPPSKGGPIITPPAGSSAAALYEGRAKWREVLKEHGLCHEDGEPIVERVSIILQQCSITPPTYSLEKHELMVNAVKNWCAQHSFEEDGTIVGTMNGESDIPFMSEPDEEDEFSSFEFAES
jgi:hypothetical protein